MTLEVLLSISLAALGQHGIQPEMVWVQNRKCLCARSERGRKDKGGQSATEES